MWVTSECSRDRRKDATTAVAYIVLHSKRHWLIENLTVFDRHQVAGKGCRFYVVLENLQIIFQITFLLDLENFQEY